MNHCHVSAQIDAHAEEYGRLQIQNERINEEFASRMLDQSWIVDGLRNLGLTDEQMIATALLTGDECQAGKLLDIAVRRHVMERAEDDLGEET
jgi:hypothetical protein